MGALLSLFRKPAIEAQLQQLDAEIHTIEERRLELYANKRKRVSSLLFYSVLGWLVYTIYFYIFYFRAPHTDWLSKALVASPILALPFSVFLLQRLITFYYTRKIANDEANLLALKAKQKAKLEELAAKTDFYKTQALLDRYSKAVNAPLADPDARLPSKIAPKTPTSALRQRVTPARQPQPLPALTPARAPATPSAASRDGPDRPPPTPPIVSEPIVAVQRVPVTPMPVPTDVIRLAQDQPVRSIARPSTPIDPNRPWWDKLVDYIVGDSPGDSVETRCKNCNVPNGLAPRDEIPFIAFRCKACGCFNEKQRERLADGSVRDVRGSHRDAPDATDTDRLRRSDEGVAASASRLEGEAAAQGAPSQLPDDDNAVSADLTGGEQLDGQQ